MNRPHWADQFRKRLSPPKGFPGRMPGTLRARVVVAALVAAGALVAGTAVARPAASPAASAANRYAAAATAYQNKVIARALATVPGGIRVSADEVTWPKNKSGLIVPASAAARVTLTAAEEPAANDECYVGYFCAWNAKDYSGCEYYIENGPDTANIWVDWPQFVAGICGTPGIGTWSWANTSDYRVWKEQYKIAGTYLGDYQWYGGSGSGTTYCISPLTAVAEFENATARVLGWIQMTKNSANC